MVIGKVIGTTEWLFIPVRMESIRMLKTIFPFVTEVA